MKTRMIELILVLIAAVLFTWGVVSAVNRGDPAAKRWTTYAMSGLVILAGVNIALRSKTLAGVIIAVSALLLLLALAAALLSQADRTPHPILAVARSVIFLALLVVTGWIQLHSTRQPPDSALEPTATAPSVSDKP